MRDFSTFFFFFLFLFFFGGRGGGLCRPRVTTTGTEGAPGSTKKPNRKTAHGYNHGLICHSQFEISSTLCPNLGNNIQTHSTSAVESYKVNWCPTVGFPRFPLLLVNNLGSNSSMFRWRQQLFSGSICGMWYKRRGKQWHFPFKIQVVWGFWSIIVEFHRTSFMVASWGNHSSFYSQDINNFGENHHKRYQEIPKILLLAFVIGPRKSDLQQK